MQEITEKKAKINNVPDVILEIIESRGIGEDELDEFFSPKA